MKLAYTADGARILGFFAPKDGLIQTASICGYNGFDWIQRVQSDTYYDNGANSGSILARIQPPFNDPPKGGLGGASYDKNKMDTRSNYPFYYAIEGVSASTNNYFSLSYNEVSKVNLCPHQNYNVTNNTVNSSVLCYTDEPFQPYSGIINFTTYLVGYSIDEFKHITYGPPLAHWYWSDTLGAYSPQDSGFVGGISIYSASANVIIINK